LIHRGFISAFIMVVMVVEKQGRQDAEEKQQDRKPWALREFGGKPVWDWLDLLLVPLVLGIVAAGLTAWFNEQQDARQNDIEERRAEAQRKLEEQRADDAALQSYLDQMNNLLLEHNLRNPEEGQDSEVRTIARARTLTVLGRLDSSRKKQVMQFLYEADLINSPQPVISLAGANLQSVDLRGTDLSGGAFGPRDLEGFDDLCAYRSRDDLNKSFDSANYYGDCKRDQTGSERVNDIIAVILPSVNGVDLNQTKLRKADLSWVSLAKGNLSFASLDHAVLRNTLLVDADLTWTLAIHAA